MAYVALYRKWRPKTFPDLVGQEHVSRTLSQAVETGRVGHAYLFSGPRGTGKTSTAKILAKALNCEKGPSTEPCNECESCRRVNDGTSMDVFEIDAASNRGIDEIRDLRETVKFAPANGKYKVYIIDEVHMLTSEAFNALLKTLEEPPERVVFILATTEVHKVPATIQSRCQRYDFKRISVKNIAERLRYVADHSEISADDEALSLIARESAGGMRDALSTLDQCASLAEEKVSVKVVQEVLGLVGHDWVVRILKAVSQKDAAEALKALGELLQEGKDLRQLVGEMIAELRSLMVFQAVGSTEGVELYETSEETLKEGASFFSPDDFAPMLDRLHEALTELRWTSEPRIAVETALLALCRPRAAMMTASPGGTVPVQQGTDSVRIAQLEAQLQALSSALAARSQQAPVITPVIPAGNMPAAGTGA
ncbi:MAG: DNA polymerase III subunit gamma/tau, partial [Schwartzia sp.]|nr:DNA polymerase III subunit gamma/tau [Schwartzia sp. (in: firmicutes)]